MMMMTIMIHIIRLPFSWMNGDAKYVTDFFHCKTSTSFLLFHLKMHTSQEDDDDHLFIRFFSSIHPYKILYRFSSSFLFSFFYSISVVLPTQQQKQQYKYNFFTSTHLIHPYIIQTHTPNQTSSLNNNVTHKNESG